MKKKIASVLFGLLFLCVFCLPAAFAGVPPAGFEDEVITAPDGNPFSDTDLNSLEGKAAKYLYYAGVIGGFPDGEFKGGRYVNRAELAKFLLLAHYGDIDKSGSGFDITFSDVLFGEWYVPFVVRSAEEGIINGYPDGTFKPEKNVNTAEFLKMLLKTFDLEMNLPFSYTDVQSGSWYLPYVGIAEKYNLFPYRDSFLEPTKELTRNEVAVALYVYLEGNVDSGISYVWDDDVYKVSSSLMHKVTTGAIDQVNLGYDSNGVAHVVYLYEFSSDSDKQNKQIIYLKGNENLWSKPIVAYAQSAEFPNLTISDLSMQLDSKGNPHIVWSEVKTDSGTVGNCDFLNEKEIYYTYLNSGTGNWSDAKNISNNDTESSGLDFTIDGNDDLHALWTDGSHYKPVGDDVCSHDVNTKIYYRAKHANDNWSDVVILGDYMTVYYPHLGVFSPSPGHWQTNILYTVSGQYGLRHTYSDFNYGGSYNWLDPYDAYYGYIGDHRVAVGTDGDVRLLIETYEEYPVPENPTTRLLYLRSNSHDDDFSWSLPDEILSTDLGVESADLVLGNNNNPEIFYIASNGDDDADWYSSVFYTSYTNGLWTEPKVVSTKSDKVHEYSAAYNFLDDELGIVWVVGGVERSKLYFKKTGVNVEESVVEEPVEEPVKEPTPEPVVEEPAEEPVEEPVKEPTPEPVVEEPVEEPTPEPVEGAVSVFITDAEISEFVGDTERDYVYAIAKNLNGFYVLDDETFEIKKEITVGSKPVSMTISTDNSKAYIATSGQSAISVINLDTLEKEPDIKLSIRPYDLEASSDYLYVTHSDDQWGNGVVVDLDTYKEVSELGTYQYSNGDFSLYEDAILKISPDENYLYIATKNLSPANIYKLDISNVVPKIVSVTEHGEIGSNLRNMVLNKSGDKLFVACGAPYSIQILRTSDLKFAGVVNMEPYPSGVSIYEKGGLLLASTTGNTDRLYIFDLNDYTLIESVPLNGFNIVSLFVSEEKDLIFILTNADGVPDLQAITIIDLSAIGNK